MPPIQKVCLFIYDSSITQAVFDSNYADLQNSFFRFCSEKHEINHFYKSGSL